MSTDNFILMGSENPDGWKLEELLGQLIKEVCHKTTKIATDMSDEATEVLSNNLTIIKNLEEARGAQIWSQTVLNNKRENEGPLGAPRIGEGSDK